MNRLVALLVCALVAGCAPVKPWQREHLAEPAMAWDPDPVLSGYRDHAYFSKEASSGGASAGAAGCGCN
jgi:hypothetical protein